MSPTQNGSSSAASRATAAARGAKAKTPSFPIRTPRSISSSSQNGHLLLVYNDTNVGDRMPLTVAISTDNDKTYPHRRNIVNKPGDTAAYPVAIQTRDGKIHVVYTSQNRQVVNRAVFDESAILGHRQK